MTWREYPEKEGLPAVLQKARTFDFIHAISILITTSKKKIVITDLILKLTRSFPYK